MHTPVPSPATLSADCTRFDERLMAYLEHELDAASRDWMERHQMACPRCHAMMQGLDALIEDAAHLPAIAPARDLWSGIAERLEAPVVPLHGAHHAPVTVTALPPSWTARTLNGRWLAIAATLLVTVSSAVTWRIARSPDATSIAVAARSDSATPSVAPASSSDTGLPGVTAATRASDVPVRRVANAGVVYEEQIDALRTIVDERFTELDSATVVVLRKNLAIIDQAIEDSRQALARDPKSRVLSATLDRALESKLSLMRRVALL